MNLKYDLNPKSADQVIDSAHRLTERTISVVLDENLV